MRLFGKKPAPCESYNPEELTPVIRSSICTGEKVACFKDLRTGALEEIMLIRNDADLEEFRKRYGIDGDIETVY